MKNSTLSEHNSKWSSLQRALDTHSLPHPQKTLQRVYWNRFFTENLLTFLLQYCGLMFSVFTQYPLPICLATGTSCGFMFMRGYSILPGIFLGTCFAYTLTFHTLGWACVWGIIFSLQALGLYILVQKYIFPTLLFYDLLSFIKFTFIALIVTSSVSFFQLKFTPYYHTEINLYILSYLILSHLNGIFIISCGLIVLDAYFLTIRLTAKWITSLLLYIIIFTLLSSLHSLQSTFVLELVFVAGLLFYSYYFNRLSVVLLNFIFLAILIFLIEFNLDVQTIYSTHYIAIASLIFFNTLLGLSISMRFNY